MASDSSTREGLPLIDVEALPGPVGEALRGSPRRLNIIGSMAHAPTCVLPQLALGRAVMADCSLPPVQRELLILLAARLDGGRYVWTQHRAIAEGVGVTDAMEAAVADLDLESPVFSTTESAVLAFGAQIVRGGEIEDPVLARARELLPDRQIVEAILTLGYYMTMNRITNGTRTPLEEAS